jgi:hypothetical protein
MSVRPGGAVMLRKLILLSFLAGMVIVPALAARDPSAIRGFKRLVAYTVLFNVAYAFAVLFLYHRL